EFCDHTLHSYFCNVIDGQLRSVEGAVVSSSAHTNTYLSCGVLPRLYLWRWMIVIEGRRRRWRNGLHCDSGAIRYCNHTQTGECKHNTESPSNTANNNHVILLQAAPPNRPSRFPKLKLTASPLLFNARFGRSVDPRTRQHQKIPWTAGMNRQSRYCRSTWFL